MGKHVAEDPNTVEERLEKAEVIRRAAYHLSTVDALQTKQQCINELHGYAELLITGEIKN